MARISENMEAFNMCCLNEDEDIQETVKEKSIFQSQCRFFADNAPCK